MADHSLLLDEDSIYSSLRSDVAQGAFTLSASSSAAGMLSLGAFATCLGVAFDFDPGRWRILTHRVLVRASHNPGDEECVNADGYSNGLSASLHG